MSSILVWQIHANIDIPDPVTGSAGSRQVPVFLIERDANQTPDRAGAERIARQVLNPAGLIPDERIHVHVMTRNMGRH